MKEKIFGQKDFEELFYRWFNDLMNFVYSYLHDEEVARDIVHDVFLTLWNNRTHLDTSWSLKSYLFTLSRNYTLNYIRHQKVITHNESGLIRDSQEFQEEIGEYETTMERLREKLACLPEKQREVLVKCLVEGKMYKQVAEELNVSVNTIKTHIKRALAFLREEMQNDMILLFLFRKMSF